MCEIFWDVNPVNKVDKIPPLDCFLQKIMGEAFGRIPRVGLLGCQPCEAGLPKCSLPTVYFIKSRAELSGLCHGQDFWDANSVEQGGQNPAC